MPFADREILIRLEADLHTVQLFLDHANISTSSRYLKPSKLALHTTIQRIDAQRRASGEAAKWEQELAEMKKTLRTVPQKCHKLVESTDEQGSESPQPPDSQSFGRLAQLVRARASHAQRLKGRMLEAVGFIQLLTCALRVVSGRLR